MKKPDRFERMVNNHSWYCDGDKYIATVLLRREHAWRRRMVKKLRNYQCEKQYEECPRCYCRACDDILQLLDKRRR